MNPTHPRVTEDTTPTPADFCEGLPEQQETLAREVLTRVSSRWSLWTLHTLADTDAPLRFTRIFDAMTGISQKMLTQTLRNLERDGFVSRRVFPQVPPRVEYELTRLGRQLLDRVDPVVAWARTQVREFEAARDRFDDAEEALDRPTDRATATGR